MQETLEELVLQHYPKLNETDKQIWQSVMLHRKKVAASTIDDLARMVNVSRTTLSRFVRKIGLNGFSEFKVRLRMELDKSAPADSRVYEDACDSVIGYIGEQRSKNYNRICELLYEANRILVYGSGDIQNTVAKEMKRFFTSAKEFVYDISGSTFDNSLYDMVTEQDVMVLISLSGNNERIVHIAKQLKMRGVKMISITEFKNNQLADLCDERLYISSTPFQFIQKHPNYKLIMPYFVLIELLFIKYATYKQQRLLECNSDINL